MPLVRIHAVAQDNARPVQPANHSHSFLFHINPLGIDLGTVGPGTNMKTTMVMIIAGAISAIAKRAAVEIVSVVLYGKLMSGLASEKGRLLGE